MRIRHRFFFAVRPDLAARNAVLDATRRHMQAHSLYGASVLPEHLHVTLHLVGEFDEVPHELLRCAMDVGSSIEMGPFDVGFDRIGSFKGRQPGGLALTSATKLKPLHLLQDTLGMAMQTAGIGRFVRPGFSPHVTLLYKSPSVPRVPIEPIRWPVNELVLIHSLVGATKHIDEGNWLLRGRPISFDESLSQGQQMRLFD